MMTEMRIWLTAIAAATLLLSVIQMLVPQGSLREVAALAGGLILLIVMVQPLLKTGLSGLDLHLSDYRRAVEQRQAELESDREDELLPLIESETAAYISDKAESMGLTLRVRVTAETDGGGVPVPVRVELTGPKSDALSEWLKTELDLPAERQVWNEN